MIWRSLLIVCALAQAPAPPTPAQPVGTGAIRGRVVAADTGKPLRDVTVSLTNLDRLDRTGRTQGLPGAYDSRSTRSDGAFEFNRLPAGPYQLNAFAPGGIYLGASYEPAPGTDNRPLHLAAGEVCDHVDLRLPRASVISGRVVDDAGTPLSRVQISLLSSQDGKLADFGGNIGTTDDRGMFRIFGLERGQWAVLAHGPKPAATSATAATSANYLDTYFPAAQRASDAELVGTRRGHETGPIEIRMRYATVFKVGGLVQDSAGRPLVGARITLTRAADDRRGRSLAATGMIGPDGRFSFSSVAPGDYRIRAERDRSEGATPAAVTEALTVIDRDLPDTLLIADEAAVVTGSIEFDGLVSESKVAPLRITAEPTDHGNSTWLFDVRRGDTGAITFETDPLSGEYRLTLWGIADGWYIRSFRLNDREVESEPRQWRPGDRVTFSISTHAASIDGVVTDERGAPADDVLVTLTSEEKGSEGPPPDMRQTDSHGRFQFGSLRPGRYGLCPTVSLSRLLAGKTLSTLPATRPPCTFVTVSEDQKATPVIKLPQGDGGEQ